MTFGGWGPARLLKSKARNGIDNVLDLILVHEGLTILIKFVLLVQPFCRLILLRTFFIERTALFVTNVLMLLLLIWLPIEIDGLLNLRGDLVPIQSDIEPWLVILLLSTNVNLTIDTH